ncbi:MAG TPA: hypothetical protein VF898_06155 [Chloroflexota bacterium]
MHVSARTFWLPKEGNAADEYEDAGWPVGRIERKCSYFRCAVADGATETSFSGEWARLLVEAYGRGRISSATLPRTITELSQTWMDGRPTRDLPWYAEAKLQSGTYSSLLGLTVSSRKGCDGEGRWKALAVGDSCLFHMQADSVAAAFPLQRAEDFTSRPHLLSTAAGTGDRHDLDIDKCHGSWMQGDRFYLMTDALAAWFLASAGAGESPWDDVDRMASYGDECDFAQWIGGHRRTRALKNDDVTLVHITVE